MKINVKSATSVAHLKCHTYREKFDGIKANQPDKVEFLRTRVTRAAIMQCKVEGMSLVDVDKFIDDEMAKLPYPNELVRELNKQEVKALVSKYLNADPRKSYVYKARTYKFGNSELIAKPDFVYFEEAQSKKGKVKVVELVSFTTGEQKFINSSRYGAGKFTTSAKHTLLSCGLLLFGKDLLDGHEGIVTIIYDALKTKADSNGNYSRAWSEATNDSSSTKNDNRCFIEVFFDKKGKVASGNYYEEQALRNRLAYTGPKRNAYFSNFKEALADFEKGKEKCAEANCQKCNFYEICHYNHIPVSIKEERKEVKKVSIPKLNAEQNKVVDAENGIFVVEAGPGSGKSQSIAYRVANLLMNGSKPKDILIISFSNAAVENIRDRIRFFVEDVFELDGVDCDELQVSTFNSLGGDIISHYYEELKYPTKPMVADEVDVFNLTKESVDWENPLTHIFDYKNYMMKIGNIKGAVRAIGDEIEIIRRNGFSLEEYIKSSSYIEEDARKIYEMSEIYSEKLRSKSLIDFNDQNYLVSKIMRDIDEDCVIRCFSVEHVIIDEFQDTDFGQLRLTAALLESIKFKSLMVVGDTDQSIFTFRGAKPEIMLNFSDHLGGLYDVKYFTLLTNYRSSSEIVELCNEYISLNKNRVPKTLVSGIGSNGIKPEFHDFEKDTDERKWIAAKIEALIKSGVDKNKIAVITHNRNSLKGISKELSNLKIVSQYDMKEMFLANSRTRAFLGYCTFVQNHSATKGLMEYLHEASHETLFDMSKEEVDSILDNNVTAFLNDYFPLDEAGKKKYLLDKMEALDDKTDAVYTEFCQKIKDKRLNVNDTIKYINDMVTLNSEDGAEKQGNFDAVTLVTAHSSKGKEWEYVFSSVSDYKNVGNIEAIEEMRRLIYVSMSRAKTALFVTSMRNTKDDGRVVLNKWWKELKDLKGFNKTLVSATA